MKTINPFKKYLLLILLAFTAHSGMAQNCFMEGRTVRVHKWSPAKGALARYAASVTDTSHALAEVIFVGEDSLGIYTIECGNEGGGRGLDYARLGFTGFDGSRKTWKIYDGNWLEKYVDADNYTAVKCKRMTEKIWELCGKKVLQPAHLKPVKGKARKYGTTITYRSVNDCLDLVWSVNGRSFMCWCDYSLEFEALEL